MNLPNEVLDLVIHSEKLGPAVRILQALSHDYPEIKEVVQQVTYGITHKFHYKRYDEHMYTEKAKTGYVVMEGERLTHEQLWDEIDERLGIAQMTLLEYLTDTDPLEGR